MVDQAQVDALEQLLRPHHGSRELGRSQRGIRVLRIDIRPGLVENELGTGPGAPFQLVLQPADGKVFGVHVVERLGKSGGALQQLRVWR